MLSVECFCPFAATVFKLSWFAVDGWNIRAEVPGMMAKKLPLLLLLLLTALPAVAPAQPIYTTNSDGSLNVSGYSGSAGTVVIPNTTNGLAVTSIGDAAFFEDTSLTNVTIGTNVVSIEGQAFSYSGLVAVSLAASVTNLAFDALFDCDSLAAITVNTNNPVYSSMAGVLFDKSQTTLIQYPSGSASSSYAMPNSVTNIGMEAFDGSANLVSVTIGTNVTDIGGAAFEYCPALASVTIPNSVTQIEGGAFAECYSLTNLAIGASVTNIESQAFLDCSSLLAISVATNNPAFSSVGGVLFNSNQTALYQYPPGNAATSYAIPNSVTRVLDNAFATSYNLTSVTIGTNVLSFGDGVFSHCYYLTSVAIPNSVTNLGFSTFFECFSLTNVTMGTGVTTLGFQDFAYCYSLAGIYFSTNAPSFSSDVFDGDSAAIAYYLNGTTGWSALFDGLPTALWLPYVQTGDASFGVHTNGFGFTINWANGQRAVVQASTNLLNPVWIPVGTNIFSGVTSVFRDSQWTNYQRRFYRLSP